jgi:hypothetical protein
MQKISQQRDAKDDQYKTSESNRHWIRKKQPDAQYQAGDSRKNNIANSLYQVFQ